MSTPEARISAFLESQGIDVPTRTFVTMVSNLYHAFESNSYDDGHTEILEAALYWKQILREIAPQLPPRFRVLDVGVGTGFASQQVLETFGSRVEWLVCLDLSPDMLYISREKLGTSGISYVCGSFDACHGEFDLVVTNALLHHLIDPPSFLKALRSLVRVNGFYVSGHEPHAPYYKNPVLQTWMRRYRMFRQIRKLAQPNRLLKRLKPIPSKSIEQLTNEALIKNGVIRKPLPPGAVSHLVDIHVPPASPNHLFWGEHGLDPKQISEEYLGNFEVRSLFTYSHIKDARVRMGWMWAKINDILAQRYPALGADFIMAAQRVSD